MDVNRSGELLEDGVLPSQLWERLDEIIDEKCKAEDIERRMKAAPPKPRSSYS